MRFMWPRSNRLWCRSAVGLVLLTGCCRASAEEITRFRVLEPLQIARRNAPVTGGVPLPQGAARNPREVHVVNEQGQMVPGQLQPTSRWPDGSIKWLLVDLQTDLPAGGQREFQLDASNDHFAADAPSIEITQHADRIEVDTGSLRFFVKRSGFNLIDEAWLTHDGQELQVVTPQQTGGVRLIDWQKNTYWSSHDLDCSVELEEQGPLRAVVHARGRHVDEHGQQFCMWDVRITAFLDRSDLQVSHTFVFDGDPEADLIRDVSLHIPLAFAGPQEARRWSAMLDDDLYSAPILSSAPRKYVSLLQETDDLAKLYIETFKKLPLEAIDASHISATGQVLARSRPWFYHAMETGRRAPGLADYSTPAFGLSVAVPEFAERHPSELQIHPASDTLRVHLWPVHADPMNLTRGRQTSAYSGQEGIGNAVGVGTTQKMLLHFHSGDELDLPLLRSQSKRLLLSLDPNYIANTKVFGELHPYDPENYAEIEDALETLFDWQVQHAEHYRWTGKWDLGATQIKWNTRSKSWSQMARHGWTVNEVSNTYGPWIMYARTGNRKYFDWADLNTRNLIDVGTVHAGPDRGAQRRHAEKHWGGGTDSTHTYLHAPLAYYYYTGDRRAYDVIMESADHMLQTHQRAETLMQESRGKWSDAGKRGFVNPLNAFALLYELTGDKQFETAATVRIAAWGGAGGHNGYVAFALEEWMMRHGASESLKQQYVRLADIRTKPRPTTLAPFDSVDGDPALATPSSGVWIHDPAPAHLSRFWHGQLFRTMGEGYRLTGNERYLVVGLEDLYDFLAKSDRSDDWRYRGQPRGWMTSLNNNMLFNVPYFLSALDSVPKSRRSELITAAKQSVHKPK